MSGARRQGSAQAALHKASVLPQQQGCVSATPKTQRKISTGSGANVVRLLLNRLDKSLHMRASCACVRQLAAQLSSNELSSDTQAQPHQKRSAQPRATHQLAVLPSNRLASFLLRPALLTSTSTPASGLQQHKEAAALVRWLGISVFVKMKQQASYMLKHQVKHRAEYLYGSTKGNTHEPIHHLKHLP